MTQLGLPVSTSQAVVGAIVGWNWFSGSATDINELAKLSAPGLLVLFWQQFSRLLSTNLSSSLSKTLNLIS